MIMIIESSPKIDGNGSHMAKTISERFGKDVHCHVRLWDLNYKGCYGCRMCRGEDTYCTAPDDLLTIWKPIAASDVLVFISPNFYGFINGELKQMIDRLYCMKGDDNRTRFKENAKAVLVLTQGSQNRDSSERIMLWMKEVLGHYGLKFLGITIPGCGHDDIDSAILKQDELIDSIKFFIQ